MTWRNEAEAWRLGLVVLDDAFAEAKRRLGDAVPCRAGCSACCEAAALFEIHAADAALVALGLASVEPAIARRIRERARATCARAAEVADRLGGAEHPMLAGWRPGDGLGCVPSRSVAALAEALAGPCPALGENGRCELHAWRPAICRLQGLPWRDPATGEQLPDLCRLDSRQADLPAQPLALHALDERREALRGRLATAGEAGDWLGGHRTTVAAVAAAAPSQAGW